jgi:DNA polymerase I-like protein with 3'-5' exonuclease and polymerase domains
MIEQEMTQALASRLHVPLKVDIGAGENWLDIQSLSV